MISLLAVMSDGQGIETATVGSEGVVGAMSGFGIRRGLYAGSGPGPLGGLAHFLYAISGGRSEKRGPQKFNSELQRTALGTDSADGGVQCPPRDGIPPSPLAAPDPGSNR
jgi:hypothetical protein